MIRPDGVNWQWERADRLVDFAGANDMYVLGHTLVWHSQIPQSVFAAEGGAALSREALLGRMEEHIETLVGRYRGRVHAWDVVNEAIDEGMGWRRSPWLNIIVRLKSGLSAAAATAGLRSVQPQIRAGAIPAKNAR